MSNHLRPPMLVTAGLLALLAGCPAPNSDPEELNKSLRPAAKASPKASATPTPKVTPSATPTAPVPLTPSPSGTATATPNSSPTASASQAVVGSPTPNPTPTASTAACSKSQPGGSPQPGVARHGAYNGHPLPPGWAQDLVDEGAITRAIQAIESKGGDDWVCFQSFYAGAAAVLKSAHCELTEPAKAPITGNKDHGDYLNQRLPNGYDEFKTEAEVTQAIAAQTGSSSWACFQLFYPGATAIFLSNGGIPPAATGPAPSAGTIEMSGNAFKPARFRVKKGGTLVFENKDTTLHTVSPDRHTGFTDSGAIAGGAKASITFVTVGEQNYLCKFHTGMTGTITVVE